MLSQSTEQVITSAQAALFRADVACVPPHVFHCFSLPREFILPGHSYKTRPLFRIIHVTFNATESWLELRRRA